MNYERFNDFISTYENKLDEESNSTNDERLQKSLAENANEYIRRSEIGTGLLTAAQTTYHGREYLQKAKGGYETLKRLPQSLEEKLVELRGQIEEGVSTARDMADTARETVQDLRGTAEEGLQTARDTVENLQDTLSRAQDTVQDSVQDGISMTRGTANEELGEIPAESRVMEPVSSRSVRFRAQANEDLSLIPEESRVMEPLEPVETQLDSGSFRIGGSNNRRIQSREPLREAPQANEDLSQIPPESRVMEPPEETSDLNQEISTAQQETKAAEQTAAGEAEESEGGNLARVATTEEEIGEGAVEAEEATGGVFTDVFLPVVSAALVGGAIYDLFDNKPKESPIAAKNVLVVPPKFTQQKESLASMTNLPQ